MTVPAKVDHPLLGLCQRIPPIAIEAEQALLGAILANNRALDRVVDFLEPRHFAEPVNAHVYRHVRERILSGRAVDAVSTMADLRNDPALEPAGGVSYIAGLLAAMVGIINAGEYGRAVVDAWHRRQLIEVGEQLVNNAFGADPEMSAPAVQDAAETALFALAEGGADRRAVGIGQAVANALAATEDAARRDGRLIGVTTGFGGLDRLTAGLRAGQFVVLGARPSMGKTALMLGMAAGAAAAGARVRILSEEMTAADLGARLAAAMAGLPGMAVLTGRVELPDAEDGGARHRELTPREWDRLIAAQRRAAQLAIEIEDAAGSTLASIRAGARRQARTAGLDLLFIDYIGLLRASADARRQNRNAEVSELSQGLKAIAKELRVPVVALSQLSRDVEKREDKMPLMSDLRDSGTLEQDADLVAFLYREHYYLTRNKPTQRLREDARSFNDRLQQWHDACERAYGRATVLLAKNRGGKTGPVQLDYLDDLTWFRDPG